MSEFQPIHERSQRMPLCDLKPHELPKEIESTEEYKMFKGLSREEYGDRAEKKQGVEAREMFERVCQIAQAIKEKGGRALLILIQKINSYCLLLILQENGSDHRHSVLEWKKNRQSLFCWDGI